MEDDIFKTIIPLKANDIEITISDSEYAWKKLEKNQKPLSILLENYGKNVEELRKKY